MVHPPQVSFSPPFLCTLMGAFDAAVELEELKLLQSICTVPELGRASPSPPIHSDAIQGNLQVCFGAD